MTAPVMNPRAFALPLRQCDVCARMKDCDAVVTENSTRRFAIGTVCEECRIEKGYPLASNRHRGL